MTENKHYRETIGLVLSSLPGYSETFFRNKIQGLQDNGFEVVIYIENASDVDTNFRCKIVPATSFNGSLLKKITVSTLIALKLVFKYPLRSYNLFKLDSNDGIPLKNRLKNLLINDYFLSEELDWLHFGFGMLAKNRENVAEAIGAKMAVSFRGFDLYLSPLKHDNCYEQLFKKKLLYHVLSNKMKDKLVANNIPETAIHVITPAIDIHKFQYKQSKTQDEVLNIICIARLHWIKGLDYTLEAMYILKHMGVNFKFKIIGDGEEYERLMFTVHQFGITENVQFMGRLSQEKVIEQLNQADIYVQYSIQEGFGNAVLEAQAKGLFCVVSDADGLRENVLHQITGLVVPKRQPKLLAQNIKDVIEMEPAKKEQIIQYAVERVKKDFNLERQKSLFLEFYKN
jgi:colanic acid/amylovoran biosynthesis glycosyltransferase